jgi:hypothetical protein
MTTRRCTIKGCGEKHKGHGLCDMHLQRLRATGTTDSPVKSLDDRFWEKVDKRGPDDCWLWTAATNDAGYGVIRPAGEHSGPCLRAHRYSAELAGMQIEGLHVLHSCDNPRCVNPAHLRPGTDAENMRDAMERDRIPVGEARANSKLTEAEAYAVRDLRLMGYGPDVIAGRFGVSRSAVIAIAKQRTWRHLNAVTPPAARDLVWAVAESLGGAA